MGSGATELPGLLRRGSPFIWGHYNSTKACGCLHTEWAEDEWAALTLHTCTGSAQGKACHVWSPWTNWSGCIDIKLQNYLWLCFHHQHIFSKTILKKIFFFSMHRKSVEFSVLSFPCSVNRFDHSWWNSIQSVSRFDTCRPFRLHFRLMTSPLRQSNSHTT